MMRWLRDRLFRNEAARLLAWSRDIRRRENALEQASMELSNVPASTKLSQLEAGLRQAAHENEQLRRRNTEVLEERDLVLKELKLGPDQHLDAYLMSLKRASDAENDAQALKDEVNAARGLRQMKQLMATLLDDAQIMGYRAALVSALGAQVYDEDLEREWQRRAMGAAGKPDPRLRKNLSVLNPEAES